MYKRVETYESIMMNNGAKVTPVMSLKDEHGGIAHIFLDDHCYVLVLKTPGSSPGDDGVEAWDGTYLKAYHWFDEAVEVMRYLPRPSEFGQTPADAEVTEPKGYSVTTTKLVYLDDFVTRRGVLLRFRVEEIHDRLKLEGRGIIVMELGGAVLTALEESDESPYTRPSMAGDPEILSDGGDVLEVTDTMKVPREGLPAYLVKAAIEIQAFQRVVAEYNGLGDMQRLACCAKQMLSELNLPDTVAPSEAMGVMHKLIKVAGVKV